MKNFVLAIFLFFCCTKYLSAQFQFVSPLPGANKLSITHNIILREGSFINASSIDQSLFSIQGSKSGDHKFSITFSTDEKTIILSPETVFAYDEEVIVKVKAGLRKESGDLIADYSFNFFTRRAYSPEEEQELSNLHRNLEEQELIENGIDTDAESNAEVRDITGSFEIIVNKNPSPGELFYDVHSGTNVPTVLRGYNIISNNGDSIFSSPSHDVYGDFKISESGYLTVYNDFKVRQEVLDSNYNLIDSFYAANGYLVDSHDFLLLPDGHAMLIAIETLILDLTVYDSTYNSAASTEWSVIQEFDENKNLIFEWRAFDHVVPTEAVHEKFYQNKVDMVHTNSLQIDNDGNILCSHRHLDQITKINRNTGEFIWRMGGVKNEFTFINEPEPYTYQHDARRISNGNITVFDNGNYHSVKHSIAKEYAVDEINKTSTLVWHFNLPGTLQSGWAYFFAAGSVQRLSTGNTLINGGYDSPDYSSNIWEVTPDDSIIWELNFSETNQLIAYRAHKYDWDPLYDSQQSIENTKVKVQVYPNPANDLVNVQITSDKKQNISFSIFDLAGKEISNGSFQISTGENVKNITINNLITGFYSLKLNVNQEPLTFKIIKF